MSFVEDQITGFQLVQRSGIEYQAQAFGSMGSAICQLDYEPRDIPSSCFGSGAYWQYFHRTSSGWTQSSAGASSTVLHDGDMDGWHYASGAGAAPASVTFSSVCAPPAPPAVSATTAATRRPSPVPLAAAQPSHARSLATVAASAMAVATPSLEAMAPTGSATAKAAAAFTGSAKPPSPAPLATWLLLGGAGSLLVGLAAVNLRRRGP